MSDFVPDAGYDFSDLTPIEIKFKVGNRNYVLREADGEAGTAYKNAAAKALTFEGGNVKSMDGVGNVEPLLVAKCIRWLDDTSGEPVEKRVAEETVRKWPAKLVTKLFNDAKRISGLEERSPIGNQIRSLLSSSGSPCGYSEFKNYVEASIGNTELKDTLKDLDEEAKND